MFVDLKTEFEGLYSVYIDEAVELSLMGVLAIAVLLATSLRSVQRLARVLFTLALAVGLVMVMLHLGGVKLHLLHLVGLLLIVAVGSNYALFLDHTEDGAPLDPGTLLSMAVAVLTTVIGFGTLASSSVPVLQAVGITVGPWCAAGAGPVGGAGVPQACGGQGVNPTERLLQGADTLLLMLPGALMTPQHMVAAGLFDELAQRRLALDLVATDLHAEGADNRIALRRLEDEWLAPARKTYRRIWLGGISRGGQLALSCWAGQGGCGRWPVPAGAIRGRASDDQCHRARWRSVALGRGRRPDERPGRASVEVAAVAATCRTDVHGLWRQGPLCRWHGPAGAAPAAGALRGGAG